MDYINCNACIKSQNHINIDWSSKESYLLLNPRFPNEMVCAIGEWLTQFDEEYASHIWVTTSGSTQVKLVALHKQAILASAVAVNEHLKVLPDDIWINPLPIFHVGGLGIWARAFLNGNEAHSFNEKWSPSAFYKVLKEKKGTLTALVPTQLYDLVQENFSSPPALRAVIIGGGALSEALYKKARSLGWPVLPSYGLTEYASQVATASLDTLCEFKFPELQLLSHARVKIDEQERICLSGPSLMSIYATFDQQKMCLVNPIVDQNFITQDKGKLTANILTLLGRLGDFVKIGGESVELGRLENILEEIKLRQNISFDVVLAAVPEERLGHVIHLFTTSSAIENLEKEFNQAVMPFERIRKVHLVPEIPRSSINKVLKNELFRGERNSVHKVG